MPPPVPLPPPPPPPPLNPDPEPLPYPSLVLLPLNGGANPETLAADNCGFDDDDEPVGEMTGEGSGKFGSV